MISLIYVHYFYFYFIMDIVNKIDPWSRTIYWSRRIIQITRFTFTVVVFHSSFFCSITRRIQIFLLDKCPRFQKNNLKFNSNSRTNFHLKFPKQMKNANVPTIQAFAKDQWFNLIQHPAIKWITVHLCLRVCMYLYMYRHSANCCFFSHHNKNTNHNYRIFHF